MKSNQLEQSYRNLLLKVGVHPQKAEEAAKNLTFKELKMIGEIWPQWATIFGQHEQKI